MVTRRSITAAPTATVNSRPSVQIHLSTRIMERADGMASVASRDHWAAILRDGLTTNKVFILLKQGAVRRVIATKTASRHSRAGILGHRQEKSKSQQL